MQYQNRYGVIVGNWVTNCPTGEGLKLNKTLQKLKVKKPGLVTTL